MPAKRTPAATKAAPPAAPAPLHQTPLEALRAERTAKSASLTSEAERVAQLAKEIFTTPAGEDFLRHLIAKVGLLDRTFLAVPDIQGVCPYRAAIRDGERATVAYILKLIQQANPLYHLPL